MAEAQASAAQQRPQPSGGEHHEPLSAGQQAQLKELQQRYVPFQARLRRLRDRARRGAWTATWLSSICSGLLFLLIGTISGLTVWVLGFILQQSAAPAQHFNALPTLLHTVLSVEFALIPPLMLFALVRTLVQLCTSHKLYAHYYRDALGHLVRTCEAQYYADEDYHLLLESARERHIGSLGFFQPKERQRSFERQLEFNACYGLPLRCAAELAPLPGRLEYMWGQLIYKFQGMFQIPLWVWLTAMVVGLIVPVSFGVLAAPVFSGGPNHVLPPHFMLLSMLGPLSTMLFLLPLGMGFQYTPRYIISRARLVALLDVLLEQPALDPAQLPEPSEPRGWWARQFKPWRTRLRAPR